MIGQGSRDQSNWREEAKNEPAPYPIARIAYRVDLVIVALTSPRSSSIAGLEDTAAPGDIDSRDCSLELIGLYHRLENN